MTNDIDFIIRVLNIFWKYDVHDDLFWNVVRGKVTFFANCSDIFWWGTSDLEEITTENISVLEQSFEDIRAANKGPNIPPPPELKDIRVVGRLDYYGADLFAMRVRKMRPQGAVYNEHNEEIWHLFDACGPVRNVGIANPKKHPSDR